MQRFYSRELEVIGIFKSAPSIISVIYKSKVQHIDQDSLVNNAH